MYMYIHTQRNSSRQAGPPAAAGGLRRPAEPPGPALPEPGRGHPAPAVRDDEARRRRPGQGRSGGAVAEEGQPL